MLFVIVRKANALDLHILFDLVRQKTHLCGNSISYIDTKLDKRIRRGSILQMFCCVSSSSSRCRTLHGMYTVMRL